MDQHNVGALTHAVLEESNGQYLLSIGDQTFGSAEPRLDAEFLLQFGDDLQGKELFVYTSTLPESLLNSVIDTDAPSIVIGKKVRGRRISVTTTESSIEKILGSNKEAIKIIFLLDLDQGAMNTLTTTYRNGSCSVKYLTMYVDAKKWRSVLLEFMGVKEEGDHIEILQSGVEKYRDNMPFKTKDAKEVKTHQGLNIVIHNPIHKLLMKITSKEFQSSMHMESIYVDFTVNPNMEEEKKKLGLFPI